MHSAGGAGKSQRGDPRPDTDARSPGAGARRRRAGHGDRRAGDPARRRRPGPVARGVARLLIRTADAVTALLGASPAAGRELISEAELRDLVAVNTRLDPMERRLIEEVLAAGARLVREVMVPRTEVSFLDVTLPLDRGAALGRLATHSRFPVVDGTHDDVVGFVHLRDLLIRPEGDLVTTVGELTREVKRLPTSKRILPALSEMRREGHHLAIVVDEYGGTAGIVTLEDLIEELVGEIHDEYDDVPELVPAGRGAGDFDGLLNLADFAERSGLVLPDGPYETVGGFLMAVLGRLPVIGDEVTVPATIETASGSGSLSAVVPGTVSPVAALPGGASGTRSVVASATGAVVGGAAGSVVASATGAVLGAAAGAVPVERFGSVAGEPEAADAWLLRVLALDGRRVARVAVVPIVARPPVSQPIRTLSVDRGLPRRSRANTHG